jgi:uncharacterized protein YdhG (YjbR/CyaY superfamily)
MTEDSPFDAHFAQFDDAQQAALMRTAGVIRAALPGAVEVISYGMPTFKAGDASGPAIIGLTGFTRHNSLFPYSSAVPRDLAAELADYPQTKGSIHFDRDRPFPTTLLKRILRVRIDEINAAYPKSSGEYRQFHANGALKVSGRMRSGEKRGTWTTYDRTGAVVRTTEH